MPTWFDKEVKRRGGVISWRTHKTKRGKIFRVAVVRNVGPRGGKTLSYEVK